MGGRGQQRFSQKPKFVMFFFYEAFPKLVQDNVILEVDNKDHTILVISDKTSRQTIRRIHPYTGTIILYKIYTYTDNVLYSYNYFIHMPVEYTLFFIRIIFIRIIRLKS